MMKLVEELSEPVYFQVAFLDQEPHDKQIEVLRGKTKHKVISCGRRSGKTQLIAGEIIRGALFNKFRRQIVITPTYKQSLIVYEKIYELYMRSRERNKIPEYIKDFIKSPRPKIVFTNGCIIDFGSADNPHSLRGEAYGRIFLDEAAFLKEDAMIAIKPMGFDTGAPIWQTSTPWGKGQFKEKFDWGKKGVEGYEAFHYNFKDNPYLSEEGVKDIYRDIEEYGEDHPYIQSEVYGNFVEDIDSYFKYDLILSVVEDYPLVKGVYV